MNDRAGIATVSAPLMAALVVVLGSLLAQGAVAVGPPGGEAGTIKFGQASFNVHEDVGTAVIAVNRVRATEGEVSVDYETADGTAVAGEDYTAASGTLTWADGEGGAKEFEVPIVDDADPEKLESANLLLSDATGGAALHRQRDHAALRIVPSDLEGDDDGGDAEAGVIKLESRRIEVGENDGGLLVAVERRGGAVGMVTVDYTTSDGSAVAGEDYETSSGTLTWEDGDRADKTFMITLLDDDLEEGPERLHVLLSDTTGGARLIPGLSRSRVGIIDDESGGCEPSGPSLCLLDNRFRVDATWRAPDGDSGTAKKVQLSNNAGLLWFFDRSNVEGVVKVLDGCAVDGLESHWVFASLTTTLEITLIVTDTATGTREVYRSPQGWAMEPIVDVSTFTACP